jgi:excisionase family DNA binding protein
MVQGYYTLEESANLLGMSPDDLKQLARKGEIRSFQDRGTWRFRIQDIQEMARRRGLGSGTDLPLGESPTPKSTDSPAPRSPSPKSKAGEAYGLSLDPGDVDAGVNLGGPAPAGSGSGSGKGSGKKSGSGKISPPPGSDSDVRLVADGGDVRFRTPPDSDIKIETSGPKSGRGKTAAAASPKSPRPTKTKPDQPPAAAPDSGARLVPIDSDSDVRIVGADADHNVRVPLGDQPPKGATDSDVRLEGHFPPSVSDRVESMLTEEINLDEELKKDEVRRQSQLKQAKHRPAAPPAPPKKSPFELSEPEMELAPLEDGPAKKDSSSDFDLTPAAESSSPVELGSDEEFQLQIPDDEITLADEPAAHSSGVNLNKPKDSGISLEQSAEASDSVEFELTLDAESTPKPGTSKPTTPKPGSKQAKKVEEESDSSEFELSLDVEGKGKADSDSEFELTLDDGSDLAPLEVDEGEATEKDIFETDFEVPALEEESGSEAAAQEGDTDLESSDFDLSVGDDDVATAGEESDSQVVALEEDEAVDDAAETVQSKKRPKKTGRRKPTPAAETSEFAELDDDSQIEAEIETAADEDADLMPAGQGMAARTAVLEAPPWGVVPIIVLLPCVLVMVLLGFMGFELVQTQQGYKQGVVTKTIGGLIGQK